MASAEGGKRQTDIRDLFSRKENTVSAMDQEGLHEARPTREQHNSERVHSDTAWLAETMKKVTLAVSIDDIKLICCDLIAKVAELTQSHCATKENSTKALNETETIKDDLKKMSDFYDYKLEGLENNVDANGEFVTRNEFDKVQEKVDDLEGRSRRNNLRICNVKEGSEHGFDEGSMEKFANMVIRQSLGITLEEEAIQRAHRVGPKKPGNNTPRDIIVYFLRYTDKEKVRKEAPKIRPKYNGSNIYINDDFSAMTIEKRKVLAEEMRKRRRAGQRSWITKDKLFFVEPDDGFVYEQTCMPPYFYITEAKKRFKARPWSNRGPQTSTPVTSSTSSPASGYSGTTINSTTMMSFQNSSSTQRTHASLDRSNVAIPPISPSLFGPSQIRAGAAEFTPAPVDNKKARSPPTPAESAAKQPRTDNSASIVSEG